MAAGRACEFVKCQASNPQKVGVERAISPCSIFGNGYDLLLRTEKNRPLEHQRSALRGHGLKHAGEKGVVVTRIGDRLGPIRRVSHRVVAILNRSADNALAGAPDLAVETKVSGQGRDIKKIKPEPEATKRTEKKFSLSSVTSCSTVPCP